LDVRNRIRDQAGLTQPSPAFGLGEEIVRADGVSFAYGRELILDSVDLSVARGEFVALVGPNGSGKSTLLKILLGTLQPEQGSTSLFGIPSHEFKDRWKLGYVPQRPVLTLEMPATVAEVVSTGRLPRRGGWLRLRSSDHDAVNHALDAVGLSGLSRRPLNELSGGQQQRAFIARALASEPDLLILDEPIAGVDADSQRRFRDALVHLADDHGGAILLVSHELSAVAQDLDRVVVLKRRVLFDGSPSELASEGVHLGIHAADLPLWLEELR
jgi:zinc transport system ATP-binding protein